jgi:hypothetical protein
LAIVARASHRPQITPLAGRSVVWHTQPCSPRSAVGADWEQRTAANCAQTRSDAVIVPTRQALKCGNVLEQQLCLPAHSVRDEEVAGSNPATPTSSQATCDDRGRPVIHSESLSVRMPVCASPDAGPTGCGPSRPLGQGAQSVPRSRQRLRRRVRRSPRHPGHRAPLIHCSLGGTRESVPLAFDYPVRGCGVQGGPADPGTRSAARP